VSRPRKWKAFASVSHTQEKQSPAGLRSSRDLVWVHFRFLGRPLSGSPIMVLLNSPTPTTMLSYFSSHSSLLPPEPITFDAQHRGVQCKHGAFSALPLPFLVASPHSPSSSPLLVLVLSIFLLLKRPRSPRLPLLSALLPITEKSSSHQLLSPHIIMLFDHGWQRK
jgi:hypothetical protein